MEGTYRLKIILFVGGFISRKDNYHDKKKVKTPTEKERRGNSREFFILHCLNER